MKGLAKILFFITGIFTVIGSQAQIHIKSNNLNLSDYATRSQTADSLSDKVNSISRAAGSDTIQINKAGSYSFGIRLPLKLVNVLDYGVVCDMKSGSDGAISASSTTFTSATASFVSGDAGKTIRVSGAGSAGADLITTIASVTNSTTIELSAAAASTVSSKAFDYGTENTSALQNAANAVPTTGGKVHFPFGKCMISGSIYFNNPTIIEGETSARRDFASDSASNGLYPYSAIYEITNNLAAAVTIQSFGSVWKNLDLIRHGGTDATSGIGLKINAGDVSLYNSVFNNFYISVAQDYSLEWRADHCEFGGTGIGLRIQNLYNKDWGDYTITDCQFVGSSSTNKIVGISILSSGGAKIIGNKFNTNISTGLSIYIASSSYQTSDLLFTGNSVENYTRAGVSISAPSSGSFNNIVIGNNQFAPYSNYTVGIRLASNTAAQRLNNITVTGNVLTGIADNDTAIAVINVNKVILSNSMTGWAKNVYIDSNSTETWQLAKVTTGSGAPATTPSDLNELYIDITNKKLYVSTGTSSSADWTITN